jgi:hypothetical protein
MKGTVVRSELERLKEDRDILETDIELMNEDLKVLEANGFEDGDTEWDILFDEITAAENEAMYLTACIDSIEQGYE